MKVRHKRTGDVLDLDALLAPLLNEYYEVVSDAGQPEHWEDCTAECEVDKWGAVHRKGFVIFSESRLDYRLRKVQLYKTASTTQILELRDPVWAFIVERRTS